MKKIFTSLCLVVAGLAAKAQIGTVHFMADLMPSSPGYSILVMGNNAAPGSCATTYITSTYAYAGAGFPITISAPTAAWTVTPSPPATQITKMRIFYNATPVQFYDFSLCGYTAPVLNIPITFSGGFSCYADLGYGGGSEAVVLHP